ncbi:DUF4360 domain-containing protein [Paractinoplanes rishiriensis]|uniref:DUF4360 domain-containing protein n=1 Tax=Paractinoplanes rishiriensis TaxID=1050105 RepID=UPI001EF1CD04|nr:DUF4360 domain-containing protein [Actinoplanes rishiriensis]
MLATTLSAGPAAAVKSAITPAPPPADEVIVDVVTTNGSGCAPGTAEVAMVPGNFAFKTTYSNYTARTGVGAAPTDFRKNCQINLIVLVPAGYTYAINKTNHHGSGSLAVGANASQRSNYYVKGQSQTAYAVHPFTGPIDTDWQTTNEVAETSMVWSPCGTRRNLNINTEVRVAAGTSDPRTTTSSLTLFAGVYHLSWARCP